MYSKLLPAYFPRSDVEASESSYLIAMRNLGEWGDKVVEDRAIRITHIPLCETASLNDIDGTKWLNVEGVIRSLFCNITWEVVSALPLKLQAENET